MSKETERAGKRGLEWEEKAQVSHGLRGLLQHRGQCPASRSRLPSRRPNLQDPSPVVDLQDGESRVLCQLFLLFFRGVRVLWPSARVTCLLGHHLVPEARPVRSRGRLASPGWGRAGGACASELPLALPLLPEAQLGKHSQASGNYARGCPASASNQKLIGQLSLGRKKLGTGLHCCEWRQNPAPASESGQALCTALPAPVSPSLSSSFPVTESLLVHPAHSLRCFSEGS